MAHVAYEILEHKNGNGHNYYTVRLKNYAYSVLPQPQWLYQQHSSIEWAEKAINENTYTSKVVKTIDTTI